MVDLDGLSLQILRQFAGEPGAVKGFIVSSGLPKTSVYRRLKELKARGLIASDRGGHHTSPSGLAELDRAARGRSQDPELERLLPHLRLMPTRVHRAVFFLAICAVIARREELRPDHHPGFLLFARPLRWKTWLAAAICHALGLDPAEHVILCPSESGRSLLTRRGATGLTVTARKILESPFVAFDEYLRATREIRRFVYVFLHGRKVVPYENATLNLEPVPMLITNPLPGKPLPECVGLDEGMMRRCIACDLGEVPIPEQLVSAGDEILERLKGLGPLRLPRLGSREFPARERVVSLLKAVLVDPELLGLVDVETLRMLCCAAGAWLSPEAAFREVMHSYLTCLETLQCPGSSQTGR
jgi:hypothetical protein